MASDQQLFCTLGGGGGGVCTISIKIGGQWKLCLFVYCESHPRLNSVHSMEHSVRMLLVEVYTFTLVCVVLNLQLG